MVKMTNKYLLWNMSWKEAEEAFKRSDTAILPVGTFHGHGPTPISIDSSSVEKFAKEVGKITGLVTLPIVPFGENEKQKFYPGSITISLDTIERYYIDIFKSLHRNGIRKVIVLNGHGGNREPLVRAARSVRELDMIIAIQEWWTIMGQLMPEFHKRGPYIEELAVSLALGGKEIADIRNTGYKGEWGTPYTMKKMFGENIKPLGFNNFEYKGGSIIIPIQAWDLDLEGPPMLKPDDVDELYDLGKEAIKRVIDYIVDFAIEFQKIDITKSLKSQN